MHIQDHVSVHAICTCLALKYCSRQNKKEIANLEILDYY